MSGVLFWLVCLGFFVVAVVVLLCSFPSKNVNVELHERMFT